MSVRILLLPERETRTVEVPRGADGFALIRTLCLNPENVILVRGGRPIPVDSRIKAKDDLKVIRVVSGG
ncbi:MAG: MoaD/ThiS family protein [Euryarchaeota archaeon]|nr:MoaD/ThiS family protein [Euryarchaeota archaeon]